MKLRTAAAKLVDDPTSKKVTEGPLFVTSRKTGMSLAIIAFAEMQRLNKGQAKTLHIRRGDQCIAFAVEPQQFIVICRSMPI